MKVEKISYAIAHPNTREPEQDIQYAEYEGWNQCHDAFNEALSVERLNMIISDYISVECEPGIAEAIRREVGLDE